jgi:uncharacterized protein (TIGR02452 family)
MSERLRAIAHDTVTIIERGGYRSPAGVEVRLSDDVAKAVAGTRHYLPDDDIPVPVTSPVTGTVEVTNESTLEAARRLGGDVACLNFASACSPGGGFLTGAQAQEESLARASALYACLGAVPEFYAHHRAEPDLRYSDRIIYSPGVPVFRADDGALLDEAYQVAFLTAAAPNAREIARNQPEHLASLPATLRARALRVLRVAAAHGERRLVLGAWGCGVFGNDPAVVAEAFADALRRCDRFDHVAFAVLDRQPGAPVYRTFVDTFVDTFPGT